ncbi:MAG: beta-1,6-N-acetylglucosaminyltransferase, partial [Clostridia bacterium]
QIEVMIELLQQTKLGTYDYISIISGDDLPLKTDVKIKEFLEENSGKEFIGIQKNNDKLEDRVKYLYNNFYFKKNRYFFEKIYVYMQSKSKLYKKNPYYKDLPKLYKGSNWFTITSKLRDYILDYIEKNPNYVKAFEKSLCCDEVFFQTIVYNSPYLENIYNEKENNDNLNSLRYIDWESGPEYPKVLVEEDFNKIKKSNCLFARKFNKNINLDKYREIFQNKNIN